MTKLSHKEAHILIQQDGLSQDERQALASHLEQCDDCMQFAATHRYLNGNLTLNPVRQMPSAELREQIFERSRKNQRRNWIMKTVPVYVGAAALIILLGVGWLIFGNSPEAGSFFGPAPTPTPVPVLSEVIQGSWAFAWPDENGEPDFNLMSFEFKSDGTFDRHKGYAGELWNFIAGSYEIDESTLYFVHESGDVVFPDCSDRSSTLEIKSIEQNKITMVLVDNPCGFDEVGLEWILARCEWPADAETNPFAWCMPIESDDS